MRTDVSVARSEIQHLVASWTVSCDREEPAQWVWTDDAVVLAPGGMCITGRDNIMGRFTAGRYSYTTRTSEELVITDKPPVAPAASDGPRPWLRHNLTTMLIELDGEVRATGLIYFLVIGPAGPIGSGQYEDEYRRVDGQWRIARRKTRLEYVPPGAQWDGVRAIAAADMAEDQE